MNKDDVTATLNDPIETSRDGEAGFRTDLPADRPTYGPPSNANTQSSDSTTIGCVSCATRPPD